MSRTAQKITGSSRDDRDAVIADLQRQIHEERDKNRELDDQYKFRVASFVTREVQTKGRIDALEKRLAEQTENDEHGHKMLYVQSMHRDVIKTLDNIQGSTAQKLQDQERNLLKAFNTKLQSMKAEMRNYDSKLGESTELSLRLRMVVDELRTAQRLAQELDTENRQLQAENQKLTDKLRTRDDDRQALLKEVVKARKETARLKAMAAVRDGSPSANMAATREFEAEEEESEPRKQQFSERQLEQARLQQTRSRQYERELRFREGEQRLKRCLEREKRTNEALRAQEAQMLQARSELEALLRQCLDDVKAEIVRRRAPGHRAGPLPSGPDAAGSGPPINSISVHDLDSRDRERVLELLLSQQRAVQLLYQPAEVDERQYADRAGDRSASSRYEEQASGSRGSQQAPSRGDEFAWLSDIPT